MKKIEKKVRIIINLCIIMFLVSCSNPNNKDTSELETKLDVENMPIKKTSGQPLFEIISKHASINIANNYLFINTYEDADGIVKIYNLDGELIAVFGSKGKGPNELIFGDNAGLNTKKNEYWLFDNNQEKLIKYKFNIITPDSIHIWIEKKYLNLSNDILKIYPYHDSMFVGTVYEKKGMFGLFSGSFESPLNIFGEYPLPIKDISVENYPFFQGDITIHEGKSLLFFSSSDLGYISCYDLTNHFSKKWSYFITQPVYKVKNGKILLDPNKHKDGFAGLEIVNNYLYALYKGFVRDRYSNKNYDPGTNQILVFNTDGKPIIKYILDRNIVSFCIDENNQTLYGISVNDKGTYVNKYIL